MSPKVKALAVPLIALLICVILAALATLTGGPPAQADTVPTPIAAYRSADNYVNVTFFDAVTGTTDASSSSMQLISYNSLDIQWVIDMDTSPPNTTTLKLQWSNDDNHWSDGPTVANAIAADSDGMVQTANMGRYTRVYADYTGTSAITLTVKAVAK